MSVTGYLALYTTLLGWQQYQSLWDIAVGTGLIYVPFISMILNSTLGPFTSMGAKDAAQIAVRRLTLNVLTAFMVIAFAAVPCIPLNPKVLHYEPLCEQDAKVATPGHTGTTYDNSFSIPTGVKVPILWYLVMAFANGITHAASMSLPCAPINYRQLQSQLQLARIQDPLLKKELGQFYNHCYVPAYSAYLSGQLTPTEQNDVNQSLKKYGAEDMGWLGSETLLQVDGLYDAYRAKNPVPGFAFNPQRDIEEGQVSNHSPWGKPDCKDWWTDPQQGLDTQLKQALPPSLLQNLIHFGINTQSLQDAAIKTLIQRSLRPRANETQGELVRGYESLDDNSSGHWLSRLVGAPMGVLYESLSFYPKLHLLINALPIIQASLLFALYAFLGLAIPFSSYRISFCVVGSVVIFSVIFCSYLWHLTQWFDNELIQALYPGLQGLILNPTSINEAFIDMIIGTMYVVLPMLWLIVMGWAGIQAGSHVAGMMSSMSAFAERAGNKVGSVASSTITKGML